MTVAVAEFPYTALATEVVPQCPLCGRETVSAPDTDRYGFPVGRVDCVCGFGYLSPRMDGVGYAQFYDGHYRRLLAAHGFDRHTDQSRQAAQFNRGVTLGFQLRDHVSAPATLLDVGGSTGAFVQGFTQLVPAGTVTVLDPCPQELDAAKRRGYTTVEGHIEDAPTIPPQSAILCVQTLDHVRQPLAVLRWLRAHLAPGGWAYLDVVDVQRAGQGMGAPYARKIDHPLYWTETAFQRALAQTGWRVRKAWRQGPHHAHLGVWAQGA